MAKFTLTVRNNLSMNEIYTDTVHEFESLVELKTFIKEQIQEDEHVHSVVDNDTSSDITERFVN
jgi:hypothetical protein